MRERGIILTEGLVLGLFFVQRYRFLTIDQFARAAGMHRDTASRQLRNLELRGCSPTVDPAGRGRKDVGPQLGGDVEDELRRHGRKRLL